MIKKINITEFHFYLPKYKDNWYLDDLIRIYNLMPFGDKSNANISFLLDTETGKTLINNNWVSGTFYAEISFRDGKFQKILSQGEMYRKEPGEIGKRKVTDLSLIKPVHLVTALHGYFTLPADDYGNSFYKCGYDLEYDIVKILDMKGRRYKHNLEKLQHGCTNDRIPNNLLIRCKSILELPYHSIFIKHKLIKDAINSLDESVYLYLHLWYFLPKKIDFKYKQNFKEYQEQKRNIARGGKYWYRAKRKRQKALKALAGHLVLNR